MNHKVFFALLACLLFSSPAFTAAEPVGQSQASMVLPASARMAMGEGGPIAEIPSTSLASDIQVPAEATRPAKISAHPLKRTSPSHPQRSNRRQANERRLVPGWVGWLALGLGLATLGLQIAALMFALTIGLYVGGLLYGSFLAGVLTIIGGSFSVADRASKAYSPGMLGLILGITAFLWPLVALGVLVLYAQ